MTQTVTPSSNDIDPDNYFFFQAEDGIRDVAVTGVQTCALPPLPHLRDQRAAGGRAEGRGRGGLARRGVIDPDAGTPGRSPSGRAPPDPSCSRSPPRAAPPRPCGAAARRRRATG